jgi:HD-GYP domain-containing protein (c-di-GMP phosphodiesterase class II)
MLALFVIVGLGPLASVAWKLIDTNREALKTSQQEFQLLLASSIAREVDIHIEGLGSQLTRLAKAVGPAARKPSSVRRTEIRKILGDVADDRMLYLRYMDVKGNSVDSLASATIPEDLEPLFEASLRHTVETLADNPGALPDSFTISEPLLQGGNPPRAALILSAPVASRGSFRGVLTALVDLQSVWNSVIDTHRTGHTTFLSDPSGRAIASSGQSVRSGQNLRGSGIVLRFRSAEGRSMETVPFIWSEQGRDVPYLGSYERTRQGWGVFVLARERQVYAPVREMVRSTMSWALAALGLAILAAVFFTGTLSTPINRLAAASRAFAAGDFSIRVRVRSRNEIGELADVFNRMAEKIEDDIRRLKRAAEENNELFLGTIRALAHAIDAKDPYTRGHSERVNKYSVIIAGYLGLSDDEIRDIHVASLLHDVGKIGIDDSVLKKPGALTPDEFNIIKTHPVLGANIMSPIRQMKSVIPGLRSHHERMSGNGYPDGLIGDEIPIMARIIAVADTFDAMTTHRPYQSAMSFEAALARINELKAVALDDRVVEAFNRAFSSGEFRDEERAAQVKEHAASA